MPRVLTREDGLRMLEHAATGLHLRDLLGRDRPDQVRSLVHAVNIPSHRRTAASILCSLTSEDANKAEGARRVLDYHSFGEDL